MNRPNNVQELQTFLGFIQYLSKFLPNMSDVSAPLRQLLEKNICWHWDNNKEQSFTKLKQMVTQAPVLRYFDVKKPLTLTVDASSKGLGAALVQGEQPIVYASRALTKSQQNYAQIEKEALAISFGCEKFHQYIFGRSVTVESDHKPLQSIFKKSLHQAPARLQRLLLSLQKYDLNVIFKPGKTMFLADTLSRAFLPETKEDLELEISVDQLAVTPEEYDQFKKHTSDDPELQKLRSITQNGWPENKEKVPQDVRKYWNFRDEISCIDGILYKNNKLIVPRSMRSQILKTLHSSHLGIVKQEQENHSFGLECHHR